MPASVEDFVEVHIAVNGDPADVPASGGPTPPPGATFRVLVNGDTVKVNSADQVTVN